MKRQVYILINQITNTNIHLYGGQRLLHLYVNVPREHKDSQALGWQPNVFLIS